MSIVDGTFHFNQKQIIMETLDAKIRIETLFGVGMTRIRTTIKHGSGHRDVDIELTPEQTAIAIEKLSKSLTQCLKLNAEHVALLQRDLKISHDILDEKYQEIEKLKS